MRTKVGPILNSLERAAALMFIGLVTATLGASAAGAVTPAWHIQPTPNPAGAILSALTGVSCTSATACTAVGYDYKAGPVVVTFAERWNGTAWAVQGTPNPGGTLGSILSGVSCTSATVCTAVGYYINASHVEVTLAERWNGTAWAVQGTPNPSGTHGSSLSGVSCTSATACTAVGNYINASHVEVTLGERWNGMVWAVQATPNPGGPQVSDLTGVSCTSATACTAVGYYYKTGPVEVTLAERWNGTAWAVQATPNPGGPQVSDLTGVSCTSATACTAVGSYYKTGPVEVTLAERWNGTAWAVQGTPNPGGTHGSSLSGVSCTSATACTAVGEYTNASNVAVTLAERWNGTAWAVQGTPNPGGTHGSGLSGVSCTSATACTAVGEYTNASNVSVTLAERYS